MATAERLGELERGASRAARVAAQRSRLEAVLIAFGSVLDGHTGRTEGPGGLFEDLRSRSPQLVNQLEQLRAEHRELRDRLDAITMRASRSRLDPCTDEPGIRALARAIARHLDREDDVVWIAYDVDLGGGGQ